MLVCLGVREVLNANTLTRKTANTYLFLPPLQYPFRSDQSDSHKAEKIQQVPGIDHTSTYAFIMGKYADFRQSIKEIEGLKKEETEKKSQYEGDDLIFR